MGWVSHLDGQEESRRPSAIAYIVDNTNSLSNW